MVCLDNFNGVELAVYDRERTICDCFKYRTKLDNEIFNKAMPPMEIKILPTFLNTQKR